MVLSLDHAQVVAKVVSFEETAEARVHVAGVLYRCEHVVFKRVPDLGEREHLRANLPRNIGGVLDDVPHDLRVGDVRLVIVHDEVASHVGHVVVYHEALAELVQYPLARRRDALHVLGRSEHLCVGVVLPVCVDLVEGYNENEVGDELQRPNVVAPSLRRAHDPNPVRFHRPWPPPISPGISGPSARVPRPRTCSCNSCCARVSARCVSS